MLFLGIGVAIICLTHGFSLQKTIMGEPRSASRQSQELKRSDLKVERLSIGHGRSLQEDN